MTTEIPSDGGGPAFARASEEYCGEQVGLSLREYAAIALRVPRSGLDWLDEMICESQRNEFAGWALETLVRDLECRIHQKSSEPDPLHATYRGAEGWGAFNELAIDAFEVANALIRRGPIEKIRYDTTDK